MKSDDTILKALKIIQQKYKDRFGVYISESEIMDVIDSQIHGTAFGLKKGISVKLPVLGTFLFLDRKKTMEEIGRLHKVKEFYSEIEFERKVLEGKIATIKRNKARWAKEKLNKPTIVDIVKRPNISNGNILYNSLSKLIKDKNGK